MDEIKTPNTTIPAPGRDLQNVPPFVPPASSQASPVTRAFFASLAIGLGIAMIVIAVLAVLFEASPLPGTFLRQDAFAAWVLVGISGLLFTGCGIGIWRGSLVLTLVLLILGVLSGWMASAVA
jgi:hypothetical protein